MARLEPNWRALAQRRRGAGKKGSVVAAAVANRWVQWLNHRMQPGSAAGAVASEKN